MSPVAVTGASPTSSQELMTRTTTADAATADFPSAFDTALGNNFTVPACQTFFRSFLQNSSFIECYPFSFYLTNSQSYVSTVRQGLDAVETVLDTACSVDFDKCSAIMASLDAQLTSTAYCSQDLGLENPLVTQAHADFKAYDLVREATCLERDRTQQSSGNSTTNATYCYTDALFNAADSNDAYLYLMPLGIAYPSGTMTPSCSSCTSRVLDLFYNYTGNASNSISYTYDSAASVYNCTNEPINTSAKSIPSPSSTTSGTSPFGSAPTFLLLAAIVQMVVSMV